MSVAAIAMALALGLGACGSGGDESSAPSNATGGGTTQEQTQATLRDDPTTKDRNASFIVKGGDNSIQRFGDEATPEERRAVSEGLAGFMEAREAGDWKAMCRHISPREKATFDGMAAKSKDLKGTECPGMVAYLLARVPASARVNTLTGIADSVRIERPNRVYALYHGNDGVDYAMPMLSHYGDYEVASLEPYPLE